MGLGEVRKGVGDGGMMGNRQGLRLEKGELGGRRD